MVAEFKRKPILRVATVSATAVILTVLILSLVAPLPVGYRLLSIGTSYPVEANPDWLSGYDNRVAFNICGSTAGNQTNYQMKLTVHAGSGNSSGDDVYVGDGDYLGHNISIGSTAHDDYGLGYPVTYVFNIPSDSTNLTAYRKHSWGGSWEQLTEKSVGEAFNGIECVRFNYNTDKAYASMSFGNTTDTLYFVLRDSGNSTVTATYSDIADYYDDRQCAVVTSHDDYQGDAENMQVWQDAIDAHQSNSVWFTAGIVTSFCNSTEWSTLQSQIDEGYVEAAAHSRTHYDGAQNVSETAGSKDDIVGNLTLPWPYANNTTEYVPCWISPHGHWDSTTEDNVAAADYLVAVAGTTHTNDWHPWDSGHGMYDARNSYFTAYFYEDITEANLKSQFDSDYSSGKVYHLRGHPYNEDTWTSGKMANVLSYIGGNTSVWYAGFGAAYMYHYVDERGDLSISTITSDDPCQDDFDDIRFTASDGTTEIDYYIPPESITASSNCTVWVEFDSIVASPGNSTFYMYYGNSTVSTTSSGSNTFIEFEDFEWGSDGDPLTDDGGSVDWSDYGAGNHKISDTIAYGGTRSAKFEGHDLRPRAYMPVTASNNIAIRCYFYKETGTTDFRWLHGDGTNRMHVTLDVTEDIEWYGTGGLQDTGDNCAADDWELIEFCDFQWDIATESFDTYLNDSKIQDDADMEVDSDMSDVFEFFGENTAGQDTWIDNVIVRKYASPEPTWCSWGEEESYTVEITNTPDNYGFGMLQIGASSNTSISYFTITNTGNCAADITIQGTDLTGGDDTWELSADASVGENIYGLMAGLNDDDDLFDTVVNLTANSFVTNLAESGTQDWGLNLSMPTSLSGFDGNNMTATITLIASEHT